MMAAKKNSGERLILEWTNDFHTLYKKHDTNRTPEAIWISTMAYCSQIGEDIRRFEYNELIRNAAHAFCWMCTFISKLNNTDNLIFRCDQSFCDLVFFKFPNLCGYCHQSTCNCDPHKMDEKKDKSARYQYLYDIFRKLGDKKYTLNEWLIQFRDIYGGRIHLQTMESIGFHFLEESGEEAQAIRELIQLNNILSQNIPGVDKDFLTKLTTIEGIVEEYNACMLPLGNDKKKIDVTSRDPLHLKARIVKSKMDLVIEFADTFSWFCAVLIKLHLITDVLKIDGDKFDIETFLINEYGEKGKPLICPTCSENDCKCQFFN
jgi:hypothetical protein